MSERAGPEPTGGGDTERGEVDPGLEVERHPDMGPPEGHPDAPPEDDGPGATPRVDAPAGSAELSGGQPGVPVDGAAEDPASEGIPGP